MLPCQSVLRKRLYQEDQYELFTSTRTRLKTLHI